MPSIYRNKRGRLDDLANQYIKLAFNTNHGWALKSNSNRQRQEVAYERQHKAYFSFKRLS